MEVKSSIFIVKGNSETISVEDFHSSITLSKTPLIDIRQQADAELAFVNIINGSFSANVIINTNGVSVGAYSL